MTDHNFTVLKCFGGTLSSEYHSVDLHVLVTLAAHPVGRNRVAVHAVAAARGGGGRLVSRPRSRRDVPLGLGDGPEKIRFYLRVLTSFLNPLPSLIEKHIGRLGDDGLLVGLGDAAVVKVVPVTIGLVLSVSSI